MKRYTLAYAVAEIYITVEAETPEQAETLAGEQLAERDMGLCHQCTGRVEPCDPYLTSTVEEP